ncbi:DUF4352 domain-containing protein [Streptomyces sp. NBC_00536]|uniref:DUF4352 domain-containing protein n=1 Tax=Streptomyces sp. NBC_00536 TaxID=2975769 RepID=UPI002E816A1C|nr:hypothetical protein [Streptomyces sp. NBC_00536]WUC82640.1 DUF4352 domain-containing protein [Streptomyces sp. NBC_00536]
MRRLRYSAAALALTAAALLGPALGTGAAATASAGPTRQAGPTGQTIELRGNRPGELLDVTLLAVTDPATPRAAYPQQDPAGRLVAVEFRLANTGTARYADTPRSGSYLLDLGGARHSSVAAATTAGDGFPDGHTLAPGDSATGWVTFELPKQARLAAVQFALNDGSADDIGQWNLS